MHSCHKFSIYHCFLFMINIISNWECQDGQSGLPTFFGNNLRESIIVSMDGKCNYCPVNQLVKVCSFNPNLFLLHIFKTCRPLSGEVQSKNLSPPTVLFNPFQKLSGRLLPPPTPHKHTRTDTVRSSHNLLHTHTVRFPHTYLDCPLVSYSIPTHTDTVRWSLNHPSHTLSGRLMPLPLCTHCPVRFYTATV